MGLGGRQVINRLRRVSPSTWADLVAILLLVYVIFWSLHPSLLFSTTTITGGDTGAHVAMPAYMRDHLGFPWHLTSWYPGWFDGMPLYSYYFVLPDFLAVLASFVIPFAVAMKLATAVGSLIMPLSAYVMGRLFRAPRPVPVALAAATLPFLFSSAFTIDGGNLFSTLAGEYSYSVSLSLAMVALGLFARGLQEHRGRWVAAAALSATLASHVLPWMFALAGIGLLWILELVNRDRRLDRTSGESLHAPFGRGHRRRATAFVISTGIVSFGLSAWWTLPFITTQSLTNSMGYTNIDTSTFHAVFTKLGWWSESGGSTGSRAIIVVAALGFIWAFATANRLGIFLSGLAVLSLSAYMVDPQGVLFNERLVPFWYLSIYLLAGWFVGSVLDALINRRTVRRRAEWQRWEDYYSTEGIESVDNPEPLTQPRFWSPLLIAVFAVVVVVAPLSPTLGSFLHIKAGADQVPNWSAWNYSGYEKKASWPEYHDLVTKMKTQSAKYGCGQAMWEYSSDEGRFGTPMALMLLPYWTKNCVGSMEGLTFESSPTVPYHFLDQAELAEAGKSSNPMVGLSYGTTNVNLGIDHLQMLGVKYFMAFSPSVVTAAAINPNLQEIDTTRLWDNGGVQWHIYLVKDSHVVEGVRTLPNVVSNSSSRQAWLAANQSWWLDPQQWPTMLASDGPSNWPRTTNPLRTTRKGVLPVVVTNVDKQDQSISFDVNKVGIPVLVKISYYPRWHVIGATGPYRVSPNLMVVVPTSKHVSMVYGNTAAGTWGSWITFITLLFGARALWRRRSWNRLGNGPRR